MPDIPPPSSSRRHDTLADSFHHAATSPPPQQYEPAPRVTTQPQSQLTQRPPFLLSLIFTPVNVLFSLFSRIFNVFGYLFPFLPRLLQRLTTRAGAPASQRGIRRPLGPQDTTARFLRELEEEYGAGAATKLPFLETGYARAYDLAKKDLKYLVVIPMAPEHEDTASFVRDTLLTDTVAVWFRDNADKVLLWAGSVQDSEAFQVTDALNINKFPATVLVAHTPSVSATAMSVIAKIPGPVSADDLIATLQAGILSHDDDLRTTRTQRASQQAERDLRDQQNSAYERSLAVDRERARQRREQEQEKARQERDAAAKAHREAEHARQLDQWKQWRAHALRDEPALDDATAVRVNVRLLDGERVTRRFAADADMEEIYAFVQCHDVLERVRTSEKTPPKPDAFVFEYGFRIVSPMPREVYGLDRPGTLRQRIGRSANLIAEKIEDEADGHDESDDAA